jgi:hypothetical protein
MRAGDLIGERFEVEMLAGSGGVGQVFRARDRATGGFVALKVLRPPSAGDTERFGREVKVLAKLQHPAIVRYVAHGKTPDGEPYLAMEWLEGEDLAARLAREPLSVAESVELVRRAADALACAHARGIVHRDIKPSNLFLRGKRLDDLKLLDFGLAWLVDASRELTRTGLVVGTLGYMAPEQALGDRAIDPRTDVFALGCVLYRCITGRSAFDSDRIGAVLMKILHEDPPRASEVAPGVPAALDELLSRMLAKEARARPADGAAVAEELFALLPSMPSSQDPGPRSQVALTHTERRFACFVVVGQPHDLVAPGAPELLVLFDVGAEQREMARAVADRHGGQFEALADGSLLITLMGGSSATDLASQAARCALELRSKLQTAPIAVAMGRSDHASGRVVSTAIDTAAELIGAAGQARRGPPPIHIDATVAGLLDPSFEVSGDERGLVLLGERAAVERPRLLLGKPTPCVGRERELGALAAAFAECAGDRVARAVVVTGPPGSGKSRLRREALRALRERGDVAEIWLTSGQPLAADAPFSLAGGLVRAAARLVPEDAPAVRRQKLLARVHRNLPRGQAERVAVFLGEIASAPFPEDTDGEAGEALRAARADRAQLGDQVRRAFHELLAAESEVQPLVLVVEDMHWGDPQSVGMVMGAVRRLPHRPLLVLGFARPDLHDQFPRLARDSAVQEIRLGELTPRASERLLRAVVGDAMPEAQIRSIVERAGGNPFYLEELLRAAASGRGGELPETVLAMVQARLAALDPEARRVLRAASIFGPRFPPEGVSALLGARAGGEEIGEWLRTLIDAELIEPPGGSWEDSGELAFRHWIVREAVYGTLAEHDLRLGHRLAGEWLQAGGRADAATVARHFTIAGAGGEPESKKR